MHIWLALKGHFRYLREKKYLKATPTERSSYKFSISTLCAINSQQSSFVLRVGTKITIGPWTIIPAVRTDHDAISLELGKLENELKGLGNWKMNCSLLDDEDYEEDIARMIPLWIAEGQKEFTGNRMIWDWIKYNIRAHAI